MGAGETGFVDAGADEGGEPGGDGVDVGLEGGGVEVDIADRGGGEEGVEGSGQPAEHLGAFVVDDAVGVLVPEEGHAVFPCVGGVVAEVELVHETAVEEMVGCSVEIGFVEAPAGLAFGIGLYYGDGEDVLKLLDMADEVYAVGEGAEEASWMLVDGFENR